MKSTHTTKAHALAVKDTQDTSALGLALFSISVLIFMSYAAFGLAG